jgi:hypothetical protein
MLLNQGLDTGRAIVRTYTPDDSVTQIKNEAMDLEDAIADAKKRLGRSAMIFNKEQRNRISKAGGYLKSRRVILDILKEKLAK